MPSEKCSGLSGARYAESSWPIETAALRSLSGLYLEAARYCRSPCNRQYYRLNNSRLDSTARICLVSMKRPLNQQQVLTWPAVWNGPCLIVDYPRGSALFLTPPSAVIVVCEPLPSARSVGTTFFISLVCQPAVLHHCCPTFLPPAPEIAAQLPSPGRFETPPTCGSCGLLENRFSHTNDHSSPHAALTSVH